MNEKSSLKNNASKVAFKRYVSSSTAATSSDEENVVYAAAGNNNQMRSAVEINVASSDRVPVDSRYTNGGHNDWGDNGVIESSTTTMTAAAAAGAADGIRPYLEVGSLEDLMSRRNVQHPTSNLDVMMHIMKCNVGTGILAMPFAFKNAGLAFGTIGLAVISIVCIHCMHLAVKCSHCLCVRTNTVSLNYPTTAQYAFSTGPRSLRKFSKPVRFLTNFFLCLTQLGFCCVYIVFVSNNIKDIVERNFPNNAPLDYKVYASIILVPIVLTNLIGNLKFLAPASTVANCLQVVCLGIIFYYICHDIPPVDRRQQMANFSTLPLWFGTIIFAFEGIGLVLPLENSMKTPQDFGGLTGVLNTGMVIVSCTYIAVGFYGYAKYGDDVLGSITLNLPNGILADVVRGAYAVAIFLTYAVQFIVAIQVMWPSVRLRLPNRLHFIGEMLFRISIILITFALACLIPQLGLFISLVGSFSGSFLSVILPPVLEVVTFWNAGITWPGIVKDVTIFLVGILGCATGTYVSLSSIIGTFGNSQK